MTTRVHLTNSYECGRESESDELVADPPSRHPEVLETWWNDVVNPLTGDGHPCGSREHAFYAAEIEDGPDPELIGERYEWEG